MIRPALILALCLASVIVPWHLGYAHDAPTGWSYPTRCCWGPAAGRTGDCAMIPASSVVEGPDGYSVSLAPGDHPLVKKAVHFTVPYGKAEMSPDGEYHVCLSSIMEPRCFFAGARGS